MNSFEIYGGNPLSGEVTPQGAKNEALQVLACTLISKEKIIIRNIPDILDVSMLIELLQDLGVEVEKHSPNEYSFQAKNINLEFLISLVQKEIWQTSRSRDAGWPITCTFQQSLYSSTRWR